MNHKNNFTAIRCLAAMLVIISHIGPVYGQSGLHQFGLMGVLIFFSLSGYLVTLSWKRDPEPRRFLARRALRIYPAFIVSILVCAFIVGPLVTTLSFAEYLGSKGLPAFLRNVWLFPLHTSLPGVFDANAIKGVMNGPLWTLPMEASMYFLLAALGVLGLWTRRGVLVGLVASFVVSQYALTEWAYIPDAPDFFTMNIDQLSLSAFAFFAGAFLSFYKKHLAWWIIVPVLVLFIVEWNSPALISIMELTIPYAVLSVANLSTEYIREVDRIGDPSYGIYIYGFPLQQTIMHFYPQIGMVLFWVLSLVVPTAVALASWRWIEKPALSLKPKRVANERWMRVPS